MKLPLVWIIPPVAGAIIGYVTNMVAIKMLFRPLKELRIFGLRIPFTPGILPRQRHKLADNIGAMVERELLTPEILKARLRQEDVRRGVADSISRYTEKMFAAPLGQFFPAAGKGERGVDAGTDAGPGAGEDPGTGRDAGILPFIRPLIRGLAASPVLGSALREILTSFAGKAGNHSVRDILGGEAVEAMEKNLEKILEEQIRRSAPQISAAMTPATQKIFPDAAGAFIHFLEKEEIHKELEIHGRVFLNNAILRLNVLQRFFISAGQYDKTLNERMPEIIDDLIRQLDTVLAQPEVRRRIIAFMGGQVQLCLSGGKEAPERLARVIVRLMAEPLDRPLGESMQSFVRDMSGFWPLMKGHISAWIQKEGSLNLEETILLGLERFLEKHGDSSLGELFPISGETKEKLEALLCNKFLSLADEQSGAILETINIRALVRERIDSLDMLSVERIILDVMANQLQWINVFGAILGALIGLFQAGFSWFLR